MDTYLIQAQNLTREYGTGHAQVTAAKDISLAVEPGEVVMIMGPSGSGKTTLLSMLGCLLKPTGGRLLVNGEDVTSLPERRLPHVRRKNFGFVFQSFNLLTSLTALENVQVALNVAGVRGKQARRRAEELLVRLGLGERLHFHPNKLSGGEKQRVAIARALANDPPLILADEPTANLDRKTGHAVVETFRELVQEDGRSVVFVTHDTRVEDIATRVLFIEDGRLNGRASAV